MGDVVRGVKGIVWSDGMELEGGGARCAVVTSCVSSKKRGLLSLGMPAPP